MHKLLLDGQIMISDGQYCDSVFELFGIIEALSKSVTSFRFNHVFLASRQVMHKECRLDDYDGLVSM